MHCLRWRACWRKRTAGRTMGAALRVRPRHVRGHLHVMKRVLELPDAVPVLSGYGRFFGSGRCFDSGSG